MSEYVPPLMNSAELLRLRIREAREDAERRAIDNLARYKFDRFGYYAARWVTLNALIGDKQPNPFRPFVKLAREEYGGHTPFESEGGAASASQPGKL